MTRSINEVGLITVAAASTHVSGTLFSDWQNDPQLSGLNIHTNIQSITASATLTITIEEGAVRQVDNGVRTGVVVATGAALSASGVSILNSSSIQLGARWRVGATLSASVATSPVYSVGAYKILD